MIFTEPNNILDYQASNNYTKTTRSYTLTFNNHRLFKYNISERIWTFSNWESFFFIVKTILQLPHLFKTRKARCSRFPAESEHKHVRERFRRTDRQTNRNWDKACFGYSSGWSVSKCKSLNCKAIYRQNINFTYIDFIALYDNYYK